MPSPQPTLDLPATLAGSLMAAFDWWLLIVGLIVGAGLVWLVLADSSRREVEILDDELPVEAAWISAALADEGRRVDQVTAERMLRLHRTYLASLPPDDTPQAHEQDADPVTEPTRRYQDGPVGDQERSGA